MTTVAVCDVCRGDKGITRKATHDAKTPWGPWAFLCRYCVERLPPTLKVLARRLP